MKLQGLRAVRKKRDLTLAQVAAQTGISLSYISDMERGRTAPSLDMLERLAQFYEVAPSALFAEAWSAPRKNESERPFADGDSVRNVNPASRYCGRVGTFRRYLPYVFASPGCDVEYAGSVDPCDYPYVAQRVADLERTEDV